MSANRFSRAPLVLDGFDKEEAARDAMLADAVTSGIRGLTILSSRDDTSWMVAERPPRPQSAPAQAGGGRTSFWSTFPGSVLVASSALTDAPLLCSLGRVGGVRGGGGGTWHPSQDVHAIKDTHGKLQAIQMLYVGADDKICFRLIGSKHFCRKPGCTIKSHKNNKFAMGSTGGWFIAAKSNQMKDPSAFVRPFLGVNKITENTVLILKNLLSQRTMVQWEMFTVKAQEEYEEEQGVSVLDNIHEDSGTGEDSKDNGSGGPTPRTLSGGFRLGL